MKYQAYPEYKDSGVEWLGEVPEHWLLCSFRHSISDVFNGLTSTQVDEAEDTVAVTRIETISTGVIDEERLGFISCKEAREDRKLVLGDILFSNINSLNMVGNCAIYTGGRAIYAGMNLLVLKPANSVKPKWLYWLIKSPVFRQVIESLAKPAINQASISQSSINSIGITVPLENEQQAIANFLDHETAKIDTLIEKQQQLIKLLKEKRQAVISHAVTKGLNPNATMRDSGVEWLGEVPKHWVVKRLRYVGVCQNGINIGAEFFGYGYPFVSYGDAYKNEVLPKHVNGLVQSSELARKTYSVLDGDVIFTRTSETIDEIGFSSTCLTTIENASFAGFLIRFRPKNNVLDANFSKYYFRNILLRDFFIKEMNLVTRASLSQDLLKKLPVVLPSLEEQKQIAEFLDNKASIFSKLIGNAESAIELIKERRTALISAAVTGKIDVRNWQSPEYLHSNKETNKEEAA